MSRKMNKIFLSIIFSFTIIILKLTSVSAAPLENVPVELKQYNGEIIKCYVSGDEYSHYFHDANSYVIVKDSGSRYVYAENVNGVPIPSKILVNSIIKMPDNLAKLSDIKVSPDLIKKKQEIKNDRSLLGVEQSYPTTGILNNVVVFLKFQDDSEFTTPLSSFSGKFNTDIVSMKNYFKEVSYNKLTVNSSFYPASSTNNVISYTDSQPRGYYRPYSWDNPSGYNTEEERAVREQTLIRNTIRGIASQIPASINLDNNNDGIIDSLVFVVKGGTDAWADLLWPHKWSLSSYYGSDVFINGKKAVTYSFQLDEFLQNQGVGVLSHEMFHVLGAPDLYHYSYDGLKPVGYWDLMENTTKQHMGAYMKYRYGKWIDNIPEVGAGNYSLNPLTSSTNNAYKIRIPGSNNEFLILEYRKKTGNYESELPGSGLLVYRINTTQDGSGNRNGPPDEVYICRPGGSSTSNGYLNSANLSSTVGRSSSDGVINIIDSNGNNVNVKINNIVENASNITFTVDAPAAPPSFNLISGTYIGAQSLVMSSSTAGGTIRYTLDGTEPTAASPIYTSPISISTNKTVKAKVFYNGNYSDTSTVDINIQSVLESVHPYTNNMNNSWIVNAPSNVQRVTLVFDALTEVENNYDKIYITDANGNNISGSPFTGTSLSGKAITINGSKATIKLTSDSSITKYGFKVNSIKYGYGFSGYYANYVQGNNLTISGWGIYKNPISKYDVYIDNVWYGNTTRFARNDLSTKYPYTDLSAAGFSLNLDTRVLKNGNHNVMVIARSSDGSSYNLGTKVVNINTAYMAYKKSLDTFSKINNTTYKINGWVAYGKAISKVEIVEGNVVLAQARRFQRNDVSTAFPAYYTVNSGYEFIFDTRTVKNGTHYLTIKATAIDGTSCVIGTRTITVNDPYMAYKSSIDSISKINSTTYRVQGWGIYGKAVSRVEILVDNVVKGQATRVQRADVTKAFPTYYTVNAGFQYDLNTTGLSVGAHTLSIRLVGVDGTVYNLKNSVIYR